MLRALRLARGIVLWLQTVYTAQLTNKIKRNCYSRIYQSPQAIKVIFTVCSQGKPQSAYFGALAGFGGNAMSKMEMLDKKIILEVEWVDLSECKIGVICTVQPGGNKSGLSSTARITLRCSEIVEAQITRQIRQANNGNQAELESNAAPEVMEQTKLKL